MKTDTTLLLAGVKDRLVRTSEPLYVQIRNLLAEKIRNGEFKHGKRLPPDLELARQLGVNRLTYAKALNLLRREGLVERHARKGTFVKALHDARALAYGANARLVGVLFDVAAEEAFHAKLFVSLHRALTDVGLAVKFLSAENSADIQFAQLRSLIHGGRVVGCVVWSVMTPEQIAQIMVLRPSTFPIIFLDRCVDEQASDFVGYDDVLAGRLLARYLLDQGHRHVCVPVLSRSLQLSTIRDRLSGLREEFAAEPNGGGDGIHVHELGDEAVVPIRDILRERPDRATVVALDDTTALRCVKAAREASVRIPEDLVVATFETRDLCGDPKYDLTAVRLPVEEMGTRAVSTLVARLGGDTRSAWQERLPGELVVRSSTDAIKRDRTIEILMSRFGLILDRQKRRVGYAQACE